MTACIRDALLLFTACCLAHIQQQDPWTINCTSNPCAPGICIPQNTDDYRCLCPTGYTGGRLAYACKRVPESDCNNCTWQHTGTACDSSPCKYGGTCVNLYLDTFVCICPAGRRGELCQSGIVCIDCYSTGYRQNTCTLPNTTSIIEATRDKQYSKTLCSSDKWTFGIDDETSEGFIRVNAGCSARFCLDVELAIPRVCHRYCLEGMCDTAGHRKCDDYMCQNGYYVSNETETAGNCIQFPCPSVGDPNYRASQRYLDPGSADCSVYVDCSGNNSSYTAERSRCPCNVACPTRLRYSEMNDTCVASLSCAYENAGRVLPID